MTRRIRLALASALAVAAGLALGQGPPSIAVAPGTSVTSVLETVPAGTVVRLLPGAHEPFRIERPVSILGSEGAVVGGGVRILADGVRLVDVVVRGGEDGITVREADGVLLARVSVHGAIWHGIEVIDGSALIHGCSVSGVDPTYGQGIEVRNANGRPRTVIEGCTIRGGMEGIVTHVSRAEVRHNVVTGTTLRGISITEMSEGLAEGNLVRGAVGSALYCGDMSHCEFRDNVARGVAADPGGVRSLGGLGAVAWYYSTMRVQGNVFDVAAAEPVIAVHGSILTEEFPLAIWPAGWRGAIPGAWVVAVSIGALLAVWFGVATARRRRARRRTAQGERVADAGETLERVSRRLPERALAVLVAGLVVQSFHILEHFVQVFQVYVAETEIRSGLAGQKIDTEWVHFIYNLAVLALMVWACTLFLRRREDIRPPVRGPLGAAIAWLVAGTLIQTYHFAEHAAKIVQHTAQKIDPAPGIVGGRLGLVWFHFGINLAVYVAFAAAIVPLVRPAVADALGRARRWLESGGAEELVLERAG